MDTNTATFINELAADIHDLQINWWLDISKPCTLCSASGTVDLLYLQSPYAADEQWRPAICPKCKGLKYEMKDRNYGEMLMLIVTELAESMEGYRKSLMDDHLPHRKMTEVELADAVVRILDLGVGMGFDIGGALVEKCAYNYVREDHKIEHRLTAHGKKC